MLCLREGVCGGQLTGRIAAVTRRLPKRGFRLQGAVFVLQPRDFHSVLQMVLEEVLSLLGEQDPGPWLRGWALRPALPWRMLGGRHQDWSG